MVILFLWHGWEFAVKRKKPLSIARSEQKRRNKKKTLIDNQVILAADRRENRMLPIDLQGTGMSNRIASTTKYHSNKIKRFTCHAAILAPIE